MLQGEGGREAGLFFWVMLLYLDNGVLDLEKNFIHTVHTGGTSSEQDALP